MKLYGMNSRIGFVVVILSFLMNSYSSSSEVRMNGVYQFGVQILAIDKDLSVDAVKRQYKIDTVVHQRFVNGIYKYWIGPFNEKKQAEQYISHLIQDSHVKEAFVFAIENQIFGLTDSAKTIIERTTTESSIQEKENSVPVSFVSDNEKLTKQNLPYDSDKGILERIDNYLSQIVHQRILNNQSAHAIQFVIFYFILITFYTISFIMLSRAYKQFVGRRNKILQERYQSGIADFLFNTSENTIPESFRSISRKADRQILIDEIIRLHTDMTGEVSASLLFLFRELKLDADSLYKLKRRHWAIKIKGFREIASMGLREGAVLIEPYLHSSNAILKSEALLALSKLRDEDPFLFLNTEGLKLTQWDQLNLHVAIQRHGLEIPDFRRWLVNTDHTILSFSIRMIAFYKQFEAAPDLIALLKHDDELIRKLTIRAFGEMELAMYSDALIRIYSLESYENKLEIIIALGLMGNSDDCDFVYSQLMVETDFELLRACVQALFLLGAKGKGLIDKAVVDRPDELLSIANHINDRRIG